jgi:hypothetical protein
MRDRPSANQAPLTGLVKLLPYEPFLLARIDETEQTCTAFVPRLSHNGLLGALLKLAFVCLADVKQTPLAAGGALRRRADPSTRASFTHRCRRQEYRPSWD